MSDEDYREFVCNTLLIKALLPYLTKEDRKNCRDWLAKLMDIEETSPEAKTRNEYSFYLLICVQRGILNAPFNKSPNNSKLKPLCRTLPDYIYEEVIRQIKNSSTKLNKMLNTNTDSYDIPDLKCEPRGFPAEHPKPKTGVTALLAAFSNYEDDDKNSNMKSLKKQEAEVWQKVCVVGQQIDIQPTMKNSTLFKKWVLYYIKPAKST